MSAPRDRVDALAREVSGYISRNRAMLESISINAARFTIPDDKKELAMDLACYCVLMGPIGVAKKTSLWYGGAIHDDQSIKQVLGEEVSSSMWMEFCAKVALDVEKLNLDDKFAPVKSMNKFGNKLWPLGDPVYTGRHGGN